MKVGTDDEVHRVDSIWLGPPNATFPFRARYIAWGLFLVLLLALMTLARQFMGFGFFMFMWCVIGAIVLTRWIGKLINHERPFGAVLAMAMRELYTPRRRTQGVSGSTSIAQVRVRRERPRPSAPVSRDERRRLKALRRAEESQLATQRKAQAQTARQQQTNRRTSAWRKH
ncbi:hypothetical protein [Lentzea sp. NBRC 102530]|uniref:hypothetical protein n=1 Tax=Lentzea sp. NBRC 102530 TaxID=3032201 RepID=UPI0024A0EF41|nr:hypothetical protein [Lentzea sp. NBRC 102530]GLY54834.1 hypothetical protein Lesp01_84890 [Lentzea sp. NBRC 102530]